MPSPLTRPKHLAFQGCAFLRLSLKTYKLFSPFEKYILFFERFMFFIRII